MEDTPSFLVLATVSARTITNSKHTIVGQIIFSKIGGPCCAFIVILVWRNIVLPV